MARKNEFGRYILSAGEIGAYTVCPESWRLKNVLRLKAEVSSSEIAGRQLHKEWANKFDEANFLDKRMRFVVALFAAAFILFLLLNSR